MTPLVSVIIPTFNHLFDLKECIDSIKTCSDLSKIEIIIVMNGCTDGTEEYVKGLGAPFRYISSPEPLGYSAATNAGMSLARGEYIVLLNNDCQFLDDSWMHRLLKPFLDDPKTGVTGALKEFWGIHPHLIFFCVMFKRELLYSIGLLDEIFSPGAGEDADFCIRVAKAGLKLVQVSNNSELEPLPISFPIYHKGSQTVNEIPNWKEIRDRNSRILEERYPRMTKAIPKDNPTGVVQPMFTVPYDLTKRSVKKFEAPVEVIQYEWEFQRLIDLYKEASPERVLEIGSFKGGSLWQWINLAKPQTKIMTIDMFPDSALWQEWVKGKNVELKIHQGISSENETVKAAKEFLGAVDFLFIDADHQYLAAKMDLLLYGPLVRKGGIIALHDILLNPARPEIAVWRLWKEIKEAGYKTQELYSSPNQEGMGIGVVYI